MTKFRLLLLLAVLLLLSSLATGCQTGRRNLAADQSVVCNLGVEPPRLNSAATAETVAWDIIRHTLEGLVSRDNNDRIVAGMAESWDISDDGLVYTFYLRDAQWSNGTAVAAADFVFALKTVLNPDAPSPYAHYADPVRNAREFRSGTAAAGDLGIEAIDEKTLKITLEQATGYFLDILALGFMVPINEQFYNDAGAASYGSNADKLIYNGPYVISGWEHEVSLVMTKNEKYWNAGAVTLTEIKGLIVRDAESAVSAFIDGNLDIVDLSGSGAAIQVKAQDHEVQSFYDGATFYLELNLTRPDLQNQNIRTAIAYALNRADFCENVLKDHSAPALAFISPAVRSAGGSGSFRGKVGDLLEDNSRTKAKRLYEKGLSELDVSSLDLSILCEETESAILQANAIAAHLQANLGLELAVEPVAFGDRLQRLSGKNYDLALSGREPGYNDPLAFLELFAAGNANNHTGYSSEAYRKLLAQALITVNDKDRQKICQDMEELLLADLPIIPVYFRMQDYAVASGLKGVYRSAFQNLLFTYAYVEK